MCSHMQMSDSDGADCFALCVFFFTYNNAFKTALSFEFVKASYMYSIFQFKKLFYLRTSPLKCSITKAVIFSLKPT